MEASSPPPDDMKSGEVSQSTEQFWTFTVKTVAAFCWTTEAAETWFKNRETTKET